MPDQILLCVATAVVTAIVMFIGLNLSLGERQIDAPLTRLYAVKDPQFLRAICSVMTPAVVSGNRVEELINGDEIFPAMLEAVGEAKESRSFRINDEANMNVYDDDFARRQTDVFEADLGNSNLVTPDNWARRAWTQKALDRSAALLSSQL